MNTIENKITDTDIEFLESIVNYNRSKSPNIITAVQLNIKLAKAVKELQSQEND